jgi:hypothetical protein
MKLAPGLIAIVFAMAASMRAAEPIDRVIARATELTGSSFQSCGTIAMTSPEGEECFLAAYEHKVPAIGTFSVHGKQLTAAEAKVLTKDGTFITISATSDRAELTEHRCAEPFIAVEFTRRRVRCRDKYDPPLGAGILKEPPTWLTSKEEHPTALDTPELPRSVCSASVDGKIIVQLLVDSAGHVPEVQIVRLPQGCSAPEIRRILKLWRFSPPRRNNQPINTVEVFTLSF